MEVEEAEDPAEPRSKLKELGSSASAVFSDAARNRDKRTRDAAGVI